MNGDLVILAEDRIARDSLAASAGVEDGPGRRDRRRPGLPFVRARHLGHRRRGCFDGVRLGLLVASGSAAGVCAAELMSTAPEARLAAASVAPAAALRPLWQDGHARNRDNRGSCGPQGPWKGPA